MAPRDHSGRFWQHIERLVNASELVIDRPAGSRHPRFPEQAYPLDYGYLAGTATADGGGIDVWVGSLPGRRLSGVVCSVDLQKRDVEMKVLLGCTPDEMQCILAFHNSGSQAAMVMLYNEESAG